MFKYLFKRDTFLATISVFIIMGIFSFIPINTHFLDPIHLALADFDYNDLAYSKMHKNESSIADTNLIIVNIGYASRAEIAAMINKVNNQQPKVIGVDVFFKAKKDAAGDSLLRALFNNNKNIVSAFNFGPDSTKGFFFKESLSKGYANFVGEEEGVVRKFSPILQEDGKFIEAFGLAVVRKADPRSYNNFIKRRTETEIINYNRKPDKYLVIDGMDLIFGVADSSILKGKIVLLGYVANSINDVEDKHFTPMNTKYTGKSLPDMNGIFIHANIISMIQSQSYIHKMPIWLMWIIGFVLCWLHMSLFIKDFLDNHIWFHLLAKIAQIISAVFFIYLGLIFFHQFNIQLNMTATLAAIILAVDVLYFYEAFATWMHKRTGFKTIFNHKHD